MALRHFLLTIPLGSLLVTLIVMYLLPAVRQDIAWHELYLVIVAVNVAVTVLAYVLMPPGMPRLKRPPAAVLSSR